MSSDVDSDDGRPLMEVRRRRHVENRASNAIPAPSRQAASGIVPTRDDNVSGPAESLRLPEFAVNQATEAQRGCMRYLFAFERTIKEQTNISPRDIPRLEKLSENTLKQFQTLQATYEERVVGLLANSHLGSSEAQQAGSYNSTTGFGTAAVDRSRSMKSAAPPPPPPPPPPGPPPDESDEYDYSSDSPPPRSGRKHPRGISAESHGAQATTSKRSKLYSPLPLSRPSAEKVQGEELQYDPAGDVSPLFLSSSKLGSHPSHRSASATRGNARGSFQPRRKTMDEQSSRSRFDSTHSEIVSANSNQPSTPSLSQRNRPPSSRDGMPAPVKGWTDMMFATRTTPANERASSAAGGSPSHLSPASNVPKHTPPGPRTMQGPRIRPPKTNALRPIPKDPPYISPPAGTSRAYMYEQRLPREHSTSASGTANPSGTANQPGSGSTGGSETGNAQSKESKNLAAKLFPEDDD